MQIQIVFQKTASIFGHIEYNTPRKLLISKCIMSEISWCVFNDTVDNKYGPKSRADKMDVGLISLDG